MKFSEINYIDQPQEIYISYNGMHNKEHPRFVKAMNGVKNLYAGYCVRLKRKKLEKKEGSFLESKETGLR